MRSGRYSKDGIYVRLPQLVSGVDENGERLNSVVHFVRNIETMKDVEGSPFSSREEADNIVEFLNSPDHKLYDEIVKDYTKNER